VGYPLKRIKIKMKKIELPVYKASYDLLLFSFQAIKDMKKDYKYTVGEKLKNEIMNMIMNIYWANKTKDKKLKIKKIEKAQEEVEVVRILFRLLHDLREIKLRKFTEVNLKIEDVSRQLTGWAKSQ
jgi:hypothetical protein